MHNNYSYAEEVVEGNKWESVDELNEVESNFQYTAIVAIGPFTSNQTNQPWFHGLLVLK